MRVEMDVARAQPEIAALQLEHDQPSGEALPLQALGDPLRQLAQDRQKLGGVERSARTSSPPRCSLPSARGNGSVVFAPR